jgi:tetratricopeptide (TPR) repeat protein
MGKSYEEINFNESARKSLDEIEAETYSNALILLKINGDVSAGLRLAETLIANWQRDSAWPIRSQYADLLNYVDRNEEAFIRYQEWIAISKKIEARTWVKYSEVATKVKRYDIALASIAKAIKMEPDIAFLYILQSQIYKDIQDFKNAESCLLKACEIEPDDKIYLRMLRDFYKRMKDPRYNSIVEKLRLYQRTKS